MLQAFDHGTPAHHIWRALGKYEVEETPSGPSMEWFWARGNHDLLKALIKSYGRCQKMKWREVPTYGHLWYFLPALLRVVHQCGASKTATMLTWCNKGRHTCQEQPMRVLFVHYALAYLAWFPLCWFSIIAPPHVPVRYCKNNRSNLKLNLTWMIIGIVVANHWTNGLHWWVQASHQRSFWKLTSNLKAALDCTLWLYPWL